MDVGFGDLEDFVAEVRSHIRQARGWGDPERREENLLSIVPRDKRQPYHMRRIIEAVVDRDSFFEMGRLFGRPIITGLARLDGCGPRALPMAITEELRALERRG